MTNTVRKVAGIALSDAQQEALSKLHARDLGKLNPVHQIKSTTFVALEKKGLVARSTVFSITPTGATVVDALPDWDWS